MGYFRKILKILCTKRLTAKEVLDKVKEKRKLWKCIQSKRDMMIGHILRYAGLLKTIIENDIER